MKRVHTSSKPVIDFQEKYNQLTQQEVSINGKPRGLWYGMGNSWNNWVKENTSWGVKKHKHIIKLSTKAKILVIDSKAKVEDFTKKYTYTNENYSFKQIDWKRVSEEYDGIEIPNYHSVKDYSFSVDKMWLYGWDCDSGCVWNLNKVKVV